MTPDEAVFAADTAHLRDRHMAGAPVRLFQACSATGMKLHPGRKESYTWQLNVAPDGRFLVNCMTEPPGRFVVWMNWGPLDTSSRN
jgi:hypothetical protein